MAVFRGFDQDSNHNIQIVLGLSGAELRGSAVLKTLLGIMVALKR